MVPIPPIKGTRFHSIESYKKSLRFADKAVELVAENDLFI